MDSDLIGRAALHRRLARAVTNDNGYLSDNLDDDLASLRRIGARFIGRAAFVWKTHEDDGVRFVRAAEVAERVHREVDEDVVLQAAIFEAVFPAVESIVIPPWVFDCLGEPREERRFRFDDMVSDLAMTAAQARVWRPDGRVPDLTRAETRRWFVYRAGSYFDAGYEALHLGQLHLMAARDRGFAVTADLVRRLRLLAGVRARRGQVLLDAHSHGMVRHGACLLDFISRPLSLRTRRDETDDEDIILQWKGGRAGGWQPGGWYADVQPSLVEVDNCGGREWPLERWHDRAGRAGSGAWGWDQVSWFARRSDTQRADFLRYAYRHCRLAGPRVFFQPPLCRTLTNTPLEGLGENGRYYRANRRSDACPAGSGDEDVITALWAEADPDSWRTIGDPQRPDPVALPGPVVVLGPIQTELGGVAGDTLCPFSRLDRLGDSRCGRTLVLPRPGDHRFVVAPGGTRMEPLGCGMSPGAASWCVRTAEAAQPVRLVFDYAERTFTADDPRTGVSLLIDS